MSSIPAITPRSAASSRRPGQGLVEFALILPVLLLVVFVVIELARLLAAWLAIENAARFGVRYAVTGEFDPAYCDILYSGPCETLEEEDGARVPSIKDVTTDGAVAILRDDTVLDVGKRGYFKVTVCSNRDDKFFYVAPDLSAPSAAECLDKATTLPAEDAGGPGNRVSVTVYFDHPLIAPILSNFWPVLHLSATREGIVEQFRTARVVGLPATISGPSLTPSDTPTPSLTPTPSPTATNTLTPTATETPNCSDIYIQSIWISGDDVRADVNNDNDATGFLTTTHLSWTELTSSMRVNEFIWAGGQYYPGDDDSSPTSVGDTFLPIAGHTDEEWRSDFDGEPYEPIWGTYTLTLTFEFPDSVTCVKSRSVSAAQPPSPTPSRTPTVGPTATRTPTRTPTRTATSGPPPTVAPTKTKTPIPTEPPPTAPPPTFCFDC
jgi:hypothetical protein